MSLARLLNASSTSGSTHRVTLLKSGSGDAGTIKAPPRLDRLQAKSLSGIVTKDIFDLLPR